MSRSSNSGTRPTLMHIFAAGLAIGSIWLIGAFTLSSPRYKRFFHPHLNLETFGHETTYHFHEEGRGTSYYGKYGFSAIQDVKKHRGDNIVIWGDSFVEAFQVDDKYKLHMQLNKLLPDTLQAVAVARSGKSVIDYYFEIPMMEAFLGSVTHHYVVIPSLSEFEVDPNARFARLVEDDDLYFEYRGKRYSRDDKYLQTPTLEAKSFAAPTVQKLIQTFRPFAITKLKRILKSSLSDLNFSPKIFQASSIPTEASVFSKERFRRSADLVLSKLSRSYGQTVTLVYVPSVPYIKNGKVVTRAEIDKLTIIQGLASKYKLEFINLESKFLYHFESTGDMARGFPNTFPGQGHLNRIGHKLSAEAIWEHYKSNNEL